MSSAALLGVITYESQKRARESIIVWRYISLQFTLTNIPSALHFSPTHGSRLLAKIPARAENDRTQLLTICYEW